MLLWKVWQIHQASSLMRRWFLHIKKDTSEHHKCQVSYYAQKAENGNHQKVSPYSVGTKNKTAAIPSCNNGEILDYFKVMQGESFICQLCPFEEGLFSVPQDSVPNLSGRLYQRNSHFWIPLPKYLLSKIISKLI